MTVPATRAGKSKSVRKKRFREIGENSSENNGEEVQVIGAGRTDAGVHSLGQAVNFHLKGRWKAEELETALNGYLPDDIAFKHMETAEERFTAVSVPWRKHTVIGSARRRRKCV